MIIRDENGRAVGIEQLSDITKEIDEIESIFNKAIKAKKKGGSMSDEEKEALKLRLEDVKVLMSGVDDEVKHGANAMEIIAFIKSLTKLKKLADNAKSEFGND
ncbi:MAG: hypothetical protein IJN78_08930 [Clostridia bacterium]|nr:hypothetical protein [Clostridia bacterium]MBQ7044703.1 hypothetical protein [Clostridia bacterium]